MKAKTTGTKDGFPGLENGQVLDVASIIWCTGFVVDCGFVDLPVFDDYGYPIHERGVVRSHPGMYFMGIPFQTSLSSALIGGVGRDAEHIADQIKHRRATERATDPVETIP